MSRHHKRRAMGSVFTDDYVSTDHRRAKEVRYYCPGCGMVRAVESWGVTQVLTRISPARVIAHYKQSGPIVAQKELCPGGEIDLIKDRAP